MNRIPTESDWRSEPWGIDTPTAYKNFFGKSLREAISMLDGNALRYQEDLMFMPTRCLFFYIEAYIDYLLSDCSKGDSDGASCFFGLLEVRKDDIKEFSQTTRDRIKSVLVKLASQQTWYNADQEIYGDFEKRSEEILSQ